MSIARCFLVLLAAAPIGCGDGATGDPSLDAGLGDPSLDAGIDAPSIGAIAIDRPTRECATPPVGDWTGTASESHHGAGGGHGMHANVRWTRVSTTACVDRYEPSGTATYSQSGHWCIDVIEPASGPIESTDGELLIDRNTNPPTYTMRGSSQWPASIHCDDEPAGTPHLIGGRWTEHTGSFDGALLAGGTSFGETANGSVRWRFVRRGAVFTPPATGCSEPPATQWITTSNVESPTVTVTWTRVATQGCIDTFEPHGTVEQLGWPTPSCPLGVVYHPSTLPVQPDDGVLTIDRSTDPAKFRITGATSASGSRECRRADGSSTFSSASIGGGWASYAAELDGDHFGGGYNTEGPRAWRFTRM